jgi:hypothetical protein
MMQHVFFAKKKNKFDLSKINWFRGVIRILKVLRYKIISRSKSFFNTFGF